MAHLLSWPRSDPAENLDYSIDWSSWLAKGDSLISSNWNAPSDITLSFPSMSDNKTIVWLAGGVEGQNYEIINTVSTSQGRTGVKTINLPVGKHS